MSDKNNDITEAIESAKEPAFSIDKETIWETITSYEKQWMELLQNSQLTEDFTLLLGFLSFVNSKSEKLINTCLEQQKRIYVVGGPDSEKELDEKYIPLVLGALWERIYYPIFKWFQAWKKHIVPKSPKEKPRHVEFRKMNSKFNKFFFAVHKFYYSYIELLHETYDTSSIISKKTIEELNLKSTTNKDDGVNDSKIILRIDSKMTILVVVTINRCLLYLGCMQRYRTMNEKMFERYSINDFKKSLRYLDTALLILPSVGEPHLQKSLIHLSTNNIGISTYESIRSSLSRIPSRSALNNFNVLMYDVNSTLRKRFNELLKNTQNLDLGRTKIVKREITEYYFLALFGVYFAPASWKSKDNLENLYNNINLTYLKRTLYETIENKYEKNLTLIVDNLLMCIGGFQLLLLNNGKNTIGETKNMSLTDLNDIQTNFLIFTFDYITHLIDDVIRQAWNENDHWEYLGMIRIIECWIKTNRAVLQFSHRNDKFCRSLAYFINDTWKTEKINKENLPSHKPKREYYFEEDIICKDFACVNNGLNDFNDSEIFNKPDTAERLVGNVKKVDEIEDHKQNNELRLLVVVSSGMKFLRKNTCGVEWVEQDQKYQIRNVIKKNEIKGNRKEKISLKKDNKSIKTNRINVTELENKIQRLRNLDQTSIRSYSGSSVPSAPESFNIKPSITLTGGANVDEAEEIESIEVTNSSIDINLSKGKIINNEDEIDSDDHISDIINSVLLNDNFPVSSPLQKETPIQSIQQQPQQQQQQQQQSLTFPSLKSTSTEPTYPPFYSELTAPGVSGMMNPNAAIMPNTTTAFPYQFQYGAPQMASAYPSYSNFPQMTPQPFQPSTMSPPPGMFPPNYNQTSISSTSMPQYMNPQAVYPLGAQYATAIPPTSSSSSVEEKKDTKSRGAQPPTFNAQKFAHLPEF